MANSLKIIEEIRGLRDNWDGDSALAPYPGVIEAAKEMINFTTDAGHEASNIAPGPAGEIMLDFRCREKMLEIIIYPDKIKFVQFSSSEQPVQGLVSPDLSIEKLLGWLGE
ncbi:MAG: hypothetical protein J7527_08810 [Chitinophagaceae bacterium]|nr:hypothetical protein [Chitinophagaceae bacterium]